MILLIDNYDSFVYNLARYLAELGCATRVVRNDAVTVAEIERIAPTAIVISPGPCTPTEAGISVELMRELGPRIPTLGVCLGHQALAAALGGNIIRAPEPVHGRTSLVHHHGERLFAGLPNPLRATRYHSLIVDEDTLPAELRIVARADDGIPMALEHTSWSVFGVQFHPESILTDSGHRLLANFLTLAGLPVQGAVAGDRPSTNTSPDLAEEWWSTRPLNENAVLSAIHPLPVHRSFKSEGAMEVFDRPEQHNEYVQWIGKHWEDGLVLHSNKPPEGELKLHSARCHSIGGGGTPPANGDVWTNYPKRCSEDRASLIEWALAHGAMRGNLVCQKCEHLQ